MSRILKAALLGTTSFLLGATPQLPAHANILKVLEKAAQDTVKTGEKAVQDTGKTGEKAGQDIGKTAEKAGQDTGKTAEKAGQDLGKTLEKAIQDTGKAGETAYTFGLRQIQSIGDQVKDADRRLKDGKIVDAMWHFSTDPLKHTEQNTAKAAQESNVLRAVGQIAASAYGGPGGAAAYAAWLTYSQTGDVGMAIRVGAITGAAAWGSAAVGNIPNTTAATGSAGVAANAGVIAEKAILAGAIGGLAVAMAGGDKQAIQEGFLKSGGMMLVQSIYKTETGHKLIAKSSRDMAYCMAAIEPSDCTPDFERGPDGKILLDKNGHPKIDVRKTEYFRPHVGEWASQVEADKPPIFSLVETSKFMIYLSKIPGMNAMAFLHDHVSYELDFDTVTNKVTIVPASIATVYGTGAPAEDQIRKTVEDKKK